MFKAYGKAISNYFNFSGRARRKEIWGFVIVNAIVSAILAAIGSAVGTPQQVAEGVVLMAYPGWLNTIIRLYSTFVAIPSLALTFRRLHDSGKSGWYLLWNLFPVIGSIIVFVRIYLKKGDAGDNKYGADPKAEIANV